jgi:hypothetical protein
MDNLEDQERQSDSYGEIEGNNILPSFLRRGGRSTMIINILQRLVPAGVVDFHHGELRQAQ